MPPPSPHRVLIIEDDADARANLRDILELDGFQVETADSIRAALNRTNWRDIHTIVLDRRLPDGSAEEALPKLKARAPHAGVIIITGYTDLDGVIAALREGADDYLIKPVNPDLLKKAIERLREQQRLAEEKRRSDAAFRNLVEAAACMIVMLRPDRTIAYFNPFAEELTGYSADEVTGRDYFDLFIPAHDRPRVVATFQQVLGGADLRNFQNEVLRRDQSRAVLLWNARRMDAYEDQPVCLAVGQDITSLKEAQAKALQSERLAAIGKMVAGLAHESRNALQRAQACLEMLELEVDDKPAAVDLIRRVQKAQDHLHRLFEELRGYVAPLQLDRCECQLSEAWREAWELLAVQRKGRQVKFRERSELVELRCAIDRFRIVQVFRILLENALAACKDPVEIEIDCAAASLDGHGAIRVAVRDNGPGLNPEQRQRIFEPFYTTKSQGTGLGMAIALRIVEAHGGSLAVGDGAAQGAEILVTLPHKKP